MPSNQVFQFFDLLLQLAEPPEMFAHLIDQAKETEQHKYLKK